MANHLYIKEGDTQTWEITLGHGGEDDPLEGATSVKLYARSDGGATNEIDGVEVDSYTAAGVVEFTPLAGAVDTPGTYLAYCRATYADGSTARFPSRGYYPITVGENYE